MFRFLHLSQLQLSSFNIVHLLFEIFAPRILGKKTFVAIKIRATFIPIEHLAWNILSKITWPRRITEIH